MEFDRKFSIGNIATIGTVLAGIVIGYASVVQGNETNTRDIRSLDVRVSTLETGFRDLLRQLGDKEIAQTRILTELQADLKYTRQAVDSLGK